jgi:hypothetical protein
MKFITFYESRAFKKTSNLCINYSRFFLLMVVFTLNFIANCQVINGYGKVTWISGASVTLTNIFDVADPFAAGKKVMLIQMQDDVIGANTADNSSFGTISSIGSAGNYEILTIATVSSGTVTFTSAPSNSYLLNPNSSVQLVTVRQFGLTDYTTTSAMAALPWDGNIGGIIAMEVSGTLTLAHSVNADAKGFRGGNKSANAPTPFSSTCSSTPFLQSSADYGFKGEGIYKSAGTTFNTARGRLANAGGGGNNSNAGGGGGSNVATGGNGGAGWQCNTTNSGSGVGGQSLQPYYYSDRVFMGGGGGGGQQNNFASTNGGRGGGIVYIKAAQIASPPSCTGAISVSANGESAANTSGGGNDGAGGGGGAGTVIIDAASYNLTSTCPLTITANAGNGGNVNTANVHGAGGAGAQGAVIYRNQAPTVNATTTTLNGTPGCNNIPCTSTAGAVSEPNNIGIITFTPLGVKFVEFNAELFYRNGLLTWKTASETNSDFFQVQRSTDGMNFENIGTVKAAGESQSLLSYEFIDYNAFLVNDYYYYRLKQYDYDGKFMYSDLRYLKRDQFQTEEVIVFPNPVSDVINVFLPDYINNEGTVIHLCDDLGRLIKEIDVSNQITSFNSSELPKGIYFVNILNDDRIVVAKKIVK